MGQTQTSFNNVSENIINDVWTDANDVNLSEERTGNAEFQILRTRLLEGYKKGMKDRQPFQTVCGLKLRHRYPRNRNELQN